MGRPESITVLGATGSIGVSTLDVISRHPERYQVYALTAERRWQLLATQCLEHQPRYAVIRDADSAGLLEQELRKQGCLTEVLYGADALASVAGASEVDMVMAAIVGAAGLLPTLAAVKAGKKVLLANKEVLVMAGGLFTQAVAEHGAQLLPIDSEHNAIFQCLPNHRPDYLQQGLISSGVRKILLTASGGPFRNTPIHELARVTPEQACAHPNWSMGQKISVDSASMMNKGLELIEACWLFNTSPRQVEVVIHPQSVIHSMVEYIDGSVLAQLGNPDMRTPIAHALAWPERIESGVASLDLIMTARLDFSAPDVQRFPCLRLAQEAVVSGGNAPVLLNAANEIAVAAFLERRLGFDQIPRLISSVMDAIPFSEPETLELVQAADAEARAVAMQLLARW
ncbi:1-deoxy-D-xylulose-5-phosphate reductoisomerase [Cellvibrio japonicus]|uniref:1-deoxy-D-xylulose 5-phosphate reductoisomerase n=1 Tax=Cellvibrio japonicus (strain Ueda107) TaxID=498211 RepID=DXR_CELJU|nr:1-deoxy-D-xylulose-5-phosphate reductoisomerase [Cellvibrio japonicus]B3PBQ4.1 RecName: Full=1-deoxy-D-xylulose 5-phosphate reductoisomerase; Short=DXP reductoisomerase; AltName: Full=1-deoxyxylulose-5-phosphate reductoisomerase; AltName: Full=2-C-methyl-D-erythritol 4-phosphate synthase [Cellvibrio japonicus Ueda107]ACE83865.1 1-deoxy-D-xylulose 5-phosphate reductoisomerase [Cellvibrio japonicus Ueda107]QEI11726.1 1-deoxy-D-xylulose-5-phosphate reductoisomerase [Cellvibrio japonicus]QEI1530